MQESLADINAIIRQQFSGVGDRLKLLREALGYKKATPFAKELGIEAATYRTYERGEKLPPHETLGRLRELTGASTDWVLYGDRSSLPHNLYRTLYGASQEA